MWAPLPGVEAALGGAARKHPRRIANFGAQAQQNCKDATDAKNAPAEHICAGWHLWVLPVATKTGFRFIHTEVPQKLQLVFPFQFLCVGFWVSGLNQSAMPRMQGRQLRYNTSIYSEVTLKTGYCCQPIVALSAC